MIGAARYLVVVVLLLAGPVLGEDVAFHDPAWSPDGTRIAFSSNVDGDFDIYLYQLEDRSIRQLTNAAGNDGVPAWSPEGSRLTIASSREGDAEIYMMAADGTLLAQLTHNDDAEQVQTWSPTGLQLAYESRRDGNHDLYLVHLLTGEERRLTTHPERDFRPSWCIGNGRIVFQSNRGGRYQLFSMARDGSDVQLLADLPGQQAAPACGPRTGRIAYVQHGDDGSARVQVMEAEGSDSRPVGAGSGNDQAPSWSPDERWLVFASEREGRISLYVASAEGEEDYPLTIFPPSE